MTSNATPGARILGSLRSADGQGVVRMQDRFDTDIDDLWSARTDPRRLARWMGEVEGDLRVSGEFRARFWPADGKAPGAWKPASPRGGFSLGRRMSATGDGRAAVAGDGWAAVADA
jgi:hypothetical protein